MGEKQWNSYINSNDEITIQKKYTQTIPFYSQKLNITIAFLSSN